MTAYNREHDRCKYDPSEIERYNLETYGDWQGQVIETTRWDLDDPFAFFFPLICSGFAIIGAVAAYTETGTSPGAWLGVSMLGLCAVVGLVISIVFGPRRVASTKIREPKARPRPLTRGARQYRRSVTMRTQGSVVSLVDGQFEVETILTRAGGVKARVVLEDDTGNRTWVYVCVPELAAMAQEMTVALKYIEELRSQNETPNEA